MTRVSCYQCQEKEVFGDDPFFPFCCQECKTKWGDEHYQRDNQERKITTLGEFRKRLHDRKIERMYKQVGEGAVIIPPNHNE